MDAKELKDQKISVKGNLTNLSFTQARHWFKKPHHLPQCFSSPEGVNSPKSEQHLKQLRETYTTQPWMEWFIRRTEDTKCKWESIFMPLPRTPFELTGFNKATTMGRMVDPVFQAEKALEYLYWGWCLIDIDPQTPKEKRSDIDYGCLMEETIPEVIKTLERLHLLHFKPARDYFVKYTGGSGFHIFIHPYALGIRNPQHNLPEVFKHWVSQVLLKDREGTETPQGIDLQVFKRKKGLCTHTFTSYRETPQGTRGCVTLSSKDQIQALMSKKLNESHLSMMSTGYSRKESGLTPVLDENKTTVNETFKPLMKQINDLYPRVLRGGHDYVPKKALLGKLACVERLITTKITKGADFNKAAMQVGTYLSNKPGDIRRVADEVSKNWRCSKVTNKADAKDSFLGRLQATKGYTHSCPALVDIVKELTGKPPLCEDCQVFKFKQGDQQALDEVNLDAYLRPLQGQEGDMVTMGGQVFNREMVMVSSFTASFIREVKDRAGHVISTQIMFLPADQDKKEQLRNVTPEQMTSLKGFMAMVLAMGAGFSFKADSLKELLQWFDYVLDARAIEVETMHTDSAYTQLDRWGMTWVPDNPPEKLPGAMVYAEPNYSIDSRGQENTCILRPLKCYETVLGYKTWVDTSRYFAKDRGASNPISEEQQIQLILLTKINEPYSLFSIVMWFIATHLKEHFNTIGLSFPLLSVEGVPGSGKTETMKLVQSLVGIDIRVDDLTVDVPGSSAVYLKKRLSETSTLPVILNEAQAQGRSTAKSLVNMVKSTYDQTESGRAMMENGVATEKMSESKLTAPACMVSEKSSANPAVTQRAISITLSSRVASTAKYVKAFTTLKRAKAAPIIEFSTTMMTTALQTDPLAIEETFDTVSVDFTRRKNKVDSRIQHGFMVLETAWRWFLDILEEHKASPDLLKAFNDLHALWYREVTGITPSNALLVSELEVDKVMATIGVMARSFNPEEMVRHGQETLERGKDYAVIGDSLFLDLDGCYGKILNRHCGKKQGEDDPVHLTTKRQFIQSAKSRDYLTHSNVICKALGPYVNCVELDIESVEEWVDYFKSQLTVQNEQWS
jgi:hypothetical protein